MPGFVSAAELAALGCAFVWALNGLILRTQSHLVSPAAMNCIRCGVAGLMLWMAVPFVAPPIADLALVPWQDWALLFIGCALGIALGDTLYLGGIKEIGVSRTMALTGTFPLTTLLWESALLGEPMTLALVLGSVLVVAGVALLSGLGEKEEDAQDMRLRYGVFLALAASVLWGLSSTLLKPATSHLDTTHANAVRMPLIALLVYFFRILPSGNESLRGISWRSFVIVGLTGGLGMGLGANLFLYAITQSTVGKVAVLTSISPVFGMAMAMVFLKEQVTWQVVAGMGLCLAGVWVVI